MQLIRRFACSLILCCLVLPRISTAEVIPPLSAPPLGERWFRITMWDQRVGFAHTVVSAVPEGYRVASEGSARMEVLGFSREASSREIYLVNRDLSLRSFVVEQTISGMPTRLMGEATAKGVNVTVASGESRREKSLKARGKVYPPSLLNLYPLMQGAKKGKKYRLQMFDPEEAKLKNVTITVVGKETLPGGGATVHLRNDLYPFVANDIWVDLAGNTVRESVRDDLIVTGAEEGESARRFILEAAIAKKELIRQFSLVRVDPPIARPADLKQLAVELAGIPDTFPLLSEGRQQAVRTNGGRVLVTEGNAPLPSRDGASATVVPDKERYLPETPDSGELAAKKNEILGDEKEPRRKAEKLARWVAANVAEGVDDSHPPLETLRAKRGDCRSRALLYVALARAAGIPTRLVAGLVYVGGKGFLYHCWAESRVGEWVAVDPNLGQVPADATHIKLAEGESLEEMAPLAGLVGRLQAKIVAQKY
ncbi:MAG TPA: transglutaminase-like domain-containing protein [Geobacteraceae bacterium]